MQCKLTYVCIWNISCIVITYVYLYVYIAEGENVFLLIYLINLVLHISYYAQRIFKWKFHFTKIPLHENCVSFFPKKNITPPFPLRNYDAPSIWYTIYNLIYHSCFYKHTHSVKSSLQKHSKHKLLEMFVHFVVQYGYVAVNGTILPSLYV